MLYFVTRLLMGCFAQGLLLVWSSIRHIITRPSIHHDIYADSSSKSFVGQSAIPIPERRGREYAVCGGGTAGDYKETI
jgi:hypothetical protein